MGMNYKRGEGFWIVTAARARGHKARVFPRSAVAQRCGMLTLLHTARWVSSSC